MGPAVRLRGPAGALAAALVLCAAARGVARATPTPAAAPPIAWRRLEPGLELGTARSPVVSSSGDSLIRILRIDPTRFALQLLNASASAEGTRYTARQWAEQHGLVAAINASLYQTDYRSSVSLMKSREHTNNPRLSKHNAVLLFDRLDGSVPPVQIADRTCRDLATLQPHYGSLVQSIRMISCHGANVWSPQPTQWSTAAIGTDREGRVLFIHMRSPLSTHELINALLALPLGLRETMYVEGGPEAQLYVDAGDEKLEFVGSHGSSFAGLENSASLPIPNAIGVRRLSAPGGP